MKIQPPLQATDPRLRGTTRPAPANQGAGAPHRVASAQVHALPPGAGADFDAARVAAIREDIRAGRYTFHAERIADGLLASARELLANREQP